MSMCDCHKVDGGYNGWSNRATWVIALWMGNQPAPSEYLYELANRPDTELYDKVDELEAFVDVEMIGDDHKRGLRGDLLHTAWLIINWREIIENHIEKE